MNKRSPLGTREQLYFDDISQAIDEMAGRSDVTLPVAFTIEDILEQLVNIAERDENDVRHRLPAGIRTAVRDRFKNKLVNSSVMQTGYRHYEIDSGNSAVPVTRYFFANFYDPGNPRCVDDMSDFDVQQSLPGKPRMIKSKDAELIPSGSIAGIVIFPPNYGLSGGQENPVLLRNWIRRFVRGAEGSVKSAADHLLRQRPEQAIALGVQEAARTTGEAMTNTLRLIQKE